jgi:predicted transcriptional regulator
LNLEKFWNRLCNQNRLGKSKHSFVRRGVVGPKHTKKLFFYVTHPRKEIRGFADFSERIAGDSKDLWNSLGEESLLSSYSEYKDFLQGRKKATFIRFTNLKELPIPIKEETLSRIFGKKRMPQMGLYMTKKIAQQLLSEGGLQIE